MYFIAGAKRIVQQEHAYHVLRYLIVFFMVGTVIWILHLWTWHPTFPYLMRSPNTDDAYMGLRTWRLHSSEDGNDGTRSGEHTVNASPPPFVLFNVLPKTGSRTLTLIAEEIAERRHRVSVEDTMLLQNETRLHKIERLLKRDEPVFIYSHEPFADLSHVRREGVEYISLVRDPIDRLVSLYYYRRYGDGNPDDPFKQEMRSRNLSKESFEDCVLRGGGECVSEWMLRKTLMQFCGGRHWRLECLSNAKRVIREKYTVVGVTEDYLGFVQVLERLIPGVFRGSTRFYCDLMKSDILDTMKTKNKTVLSDPVRGQLKREMELEYELYDFIKKEFAALKRKLNIFSEVDPCI